MAAVPAVEAVQWAAAARKSTTICAADDSAAEVQRHSGPEKFPTRTFRLRNRL